jgi:hypothetical protein
MRRSLATLLFSLLASATLVGSAQASTTIDLRGTWAESTAAAGSIYHATLTFTDEDFATGAIKGTGSGGGETWPEAGTLTGTSYTATDGPYDHLPSYTSHSTGTVAADGNSVSGTFTDTFGHNGTFTLTRLSGPPAGGGPAPTPTPTPTIDHGQDCTNATTLLVHCANTNGPPGVCGPSGTILPQCYWPVDLPTVCGPSGTILVACRSQGPYIVACGGIGTILPQCHLPPPQIPQVCGPTGTLLPPCTGANNPITVCGPSGTILPQCSFTTQIKAAVIDVPADPEKDATGKIDVDVSCAASLATAKGRASAGAQAAKTKPEQCDLTMVLETLRDQKLATLRDLVTHLAEGFRETAINHADMGVLSYNGQNVTIDPPMTQQQANAFGAANARAFAARANTILDRYFAAGKLLHTPDPHTDIEPILDARVGIPSYVGPLAITTWPLLGTPSTTFAVRMVESHKEYYNIAYALKTKAKTKASSATTAAATAATAAKTTRVVKRQKLTRGKHRIHIRIPRATVRALLREAGKHAKVVPMRVTVAFSAKPRPVVRFVDIPVRIKRR